MDNGHYSMLFIHVPIGIALGEKLVPVHDDSSMVACFGVSLLVTVVISAYSQAILERPFPKPTG